MTKRVFLVAAEPSGDLLGMELADALRAVDPSIALAGIGGAEMASAGLTSAIDTSPLSVLGFFEGLKAYPKVVAIADRAVDEIVSKSPDAVVLIDSWGFMLRVAQRLKKRAPEIHLIKLIGPQVWATRSGRAKTLAATVDHLLAMFEMEAPYYEPHGLRTTIIGSPALGRTTKGDRSKFRASYNISEDTKMLLVLPGSRPSEVKRVAPALVKAAELVKCALPDAAIVISPAQSVAQQFAIQFPNATSFAEINANPSDRYDAMAAADYAMACSGTVTSELAIQQTPFLVAYKLGWITWAVARGFLYKPEFMTLLNIAAGQEVAPEFFQTTLRPELMAKTTIEMLSDPANRTRQVAEQNEAILKMGSGGATPAARAAEAIFNDLNLL